MATTSSPAPARRPRKLGTLALGLDAAPSFLARHDPVRRPEDLRQLDWVAFRDIRTIQELLGHEGCRDRVISGVRRRQ